MSTRRNEVVGIDLFHFGNHRFRHLIGVDESLELFAPGGHITDRCKAAACHEVGQLIRLVVKLLCYGRRDGGAYRCLRVQLHSLCQH